MRKITFCLLLIALGNAGFSQQLDLVKRYTFAKMYTGLDFNYFMGLGESTFLNAQDQAFSLERNRFLLPAINIGATHFWGHADFYVSIATSPIQAETPQVENSVRFGAVTGMRVFPFKIQNQKLRPFVSYKFAPFRLNQRNIFDEKYRKTEVKSLFGLGVAYQTPRIYAYLGAEFIPNKETTIYISRGQAARSSYPGTLLNFGVNYTIETTYGAYTPTIAQLDTLLSRSNTLGWFLGIGPSSAFPLRSSSYITSQYPFLDDKAMPAVFPEMTLGYHFSKQDWIISLNFRPIRQVREAFSFTQRLKRNSLGLEAYKGLFDYHGFVPFLGAGLLYENILLEETDRAAAVRNQRSEYFTPSIVFGWDIRPSRKADIWLLRTNLRYSPFLEVQNEGGFLSLQHLEFNFIQLVVYPQRIKKYKALQR
jgi:hypothetical protein